MEWVRMWVLAWVVSGWCVDVSMGAVGGLWGFEHRRTPTSTCACLSAACLCLSGLVWSHRRCSRARQDSRAQLHNRQSIVSFSGAVLECCSILRGPKLAKAKDGGDRSTG